MFDGKNLHSMAPSGVSTARSGGGLGSYLSGGWPSWVGSLREGDSPLAQKHL